MTTPETSPPASLPSALAVTTETNWQKKAALSLAPDGKHVLVQESIARFHATKDPSKQGVRQTGTQRAGRQQQTRQSRRRTAMKTTRAATGRCTC